MAEMLKICMLACVIAPVLVYGNANGSSESPPIAATEATETTEIPGASGADLDSGKLLTTVKLEQQQEEGAEEYVATTTLASSNAPATTATTITNDVATLSSSKQNERSTQTSVEDYAPTTVTAVPDASSSTAEAAVLEVGEVVRQMANRTEVETMNLASKARARTFQNVPAGESSAAQTELNGNEPKIQVKNVKEQATKLGGVSKKATTTTSDATTTTSNAISSTETATTTANSVDLETATTSKVENAPTPAADNTATTAAAPKHNFNSQDTVKDGLYRIRLATIVTEELSSLPATTTTPAIIPGSASPASLEEVDNNDNTLTAHMARGKHSMEHLYPMKIEDFNPVIRAANAKLLKDSRTFSTRNGHEEHRQNLLPNEVEVDQEGHDQAATTKPGNWLSIRQRAQDDDVSDFTGKLLAEQDGVITEIEQRFRLNEFAATEASANLNTATTTASATTNAAPHAPLTSSTPAPAKSFGKFTYKPGGSYGFIDRRVKKSFYFPMHHPASDVMSMPHIDFANTKFNTDTIVNPVAKTFQDNVGDAGKDVASMAVGVHPEFSTTKFYNSKELYNEMMQHSRQRLREAQGGGASTTATSTPPWSFTTASAGRRFIPSLGTKGNNLKDTAKPSEAKDSAKISPKTISKIKTKPKILEENNQKISEKLSASTSTSAPLASKKYEKELKRTKLLLKATNIISGNANTAAPLTTVLAASDGPTIAAASSQTSTVAADDSKLSTTTRTSTSATAVVNDVKAATAAATSPPTARPSTTTTAAASTHAHRSTNPTKSTSKPIARPRILSRLQEKINSLECEIPNVPADSHLWRGNETHELALPIVSPAKCVKDYCASGDTITWDGEAEIQSGDILIVEISDALLNVNGEPKPDSAHNTQVYQVTRSGHEHCDVTEGILLDITPLVVDERKLVTLYDKDLTEGVNLLIVVSDLWGSECVRLKVTTKTDNCGEGADCSGKGVCFSNPSMEEYECQCCTGFAGPHCEEIDACTPSPCTNNGICVDLSQGHEGNSYQCLCPYGYTGKNCQYESDPCNPAECMNGGSCMGNSTHFRCDCTPGFAGPLCQHSLNECESSPCVHGICVDQEDGFRCFCQPGFAGELCNFEYNECESNPCQNGGECIDHIGSFECRCTKGYTGTRCHIKVDFCASKPCPEGHRCIDHGNDFGCECPGGTNGPDCNQMPRTQCNVNPCTHGGTCWSSGDSFYCACRPGYTGTMCEDEFVVETVVSSSEFMIDDTSARNFNDKAFGSSVVLKSPIELHNAYFAAGVLAAAIFIVAIVVTICHCKVNQTYRKFSTRTTTFFPILGFGRRPKSQGKLNKHWLSGKGISSGNPLRASSATSSRAHLHSSNAQYTTTGSSSLQQHNGAPFQRHLAMNLENDMYYTVDFSENSQHSPLIQ